MGAPEFLLDKDVLEENDTIIEKFALEGKRVLAEAVKKAILEDVDE